MRELLLVVFSLLIYNFYDDVRALVQDRVPTRTITSDFVGHMLDPDFNMAHSYDSGGLRFNKKYTDELFDKCNYLTKMKYNLDFQTGDRKFPARSCIDDICMFDIFREGTSNDTTKSFRNISTLVVGFVIRIPQQKKIISFVDFWFNCDKEIIYCKKTLEWMRAITESDMKGILISGTVHDEMGTVGHYKKEINRHGEITFY